MSLFSDNIRQLRVKRVFLRKNWLKIFWLRGRYVKYEDGSSEPPYDILKNILLFPCQYWYFTRVTFRKYPLKILNWEIIGYCYHNRWPQGENIIEIVPHKAQAGYLSGYADPEFIESLQHISLPFFTNGKFVPSCRWRFHIRKVPLS
jgi:general stress protein CsbA